MTAEFPFAALDDEEGEVEGPFYRWLSTEAGPDDWHRFALGANWDMHEPEIFEWIVKQPDCDKATALTLFWKAQPEYLAEFPDADVEHRSLIAMIRYRWAEGVFERAELAFDADRDAWPLSLDTLRADVGSRIDQALPPAMRQALPGRRLDLSQDIEGIPSRFWPEELR